jgi:hypothetical protein
MLLLVTFYLLQSGSLNLHSPAFLSVRIKKVKQSCYRPGVAQRVPLS